MIRELDDEREWTLEQQHDAASHTVKALCMIRGMRVNFASVLAKEVFYRTFDNRRQIASYLGLAATPFRAAAAWRSGSASLSDLSRAGPGASPSSPWRGSA
jgi:transposase